MKKPLWIGMLVLTAALVVGAVPGAFAATRPGNGGAVAEPAPVPSSPLMSLGLSDQQLAQIRELRQNTYKETRKLRIKMMDARFALSQLRLQNSPDQAALDAKNKELQDLRNRLQNCRSQAREKLKTILTPEQWTKLQETAAPGRHAGPGHGGHRGPGLEL